MHLAVSLTFFPSLRIKETPEDTVVRELSIFAFEYTTASTEEANKTDYDELAVATYEIAQQAYATFFEGVDEVHFLSTEMYQYVIHAPRVVDFKILLLFHLNKRHKYVENVNSLWKVSVSFFFI